MWKKKFEKILDIRSIEKDIYKFWEESGFFRASSDSEKRPFVVVLPPPNITGNLHIGHALDQTLQDIIIRYKRMKGFEALFVPGTDHASIATEAKVTADLAKENINKWDIGRDEFLNRTWEWKHKYGGIIVNQIKKLGISCDWSRERFTMDEGCSEAVIEFFVRLYEKKLIYRGTRTINWCPKCLTSVSDIEVNSEEAQGYLYQFRYFLKDSNNFLCVSTTRPETIFGDAALAVHPEDERYKPFIGKQALIPLSGRSIPVISDKAVKPDYGTGILKVTPAHSHEDFEIGQRHNLACVVILDEHGVTTNCGIYSGLERFEARKAVVDSLEKSGVLVKTEPIVHRLGTCYRCGTVVEPRVSTQWFVSMKPLAAPAIEVVESGNIKFVPQRFSKIYLNWLKNIKDWCISRQIWWGHRIPAWYCSCGKEIVARSEPDVCPCCGGKNLAQEDDTLDTWFSSALWPFSVFGWPHDTEDYKKFFPIDTLITGHDIIFFWVARMIFSSLELTGKAPFKHVLVHGLVRDSLGRKMSKSLGNGIDPLEIIDKYGADSLRYALVSGITPGNDVKFSEEKIEGSRNFINKIWNAARCVEMYTKNYKIIENFEYKNLKLHNSWILSRLNGLIDETKKNFEDFEFGIALQKICSLFWEDFCDWYLEISKIEFKFLAETNNDSYKTIQSDSFLKGSGTVPELEIGDSESNCSKNLKLQPNQTANVMVYVLKQILAMLHPFIPFVTEKIWQHFGEGSIMVSSFPEFDRNLLNFSDEKFMQRIIFIIKSVRARRNDLNIPSNKKVNLLIKTEDRAFLEPYLQTIKTAVRASEINFIEHDSNEENFSVITTDFEKIYVQIDSLNRAEENQRNIAEICSIKNQIKNTEKLISNSEFITKAPKAVIEKTQNKLKILKSRVEKLLKETDQAEQV
ncbi:MAG: valine--tRNA ligase [Oscillospiraceae bacterium]|nr:valine--tRNA ligase [Oscillospiraceae bacterium]